MLPNSQLETTLDLRDLLDFFDVLIKPDKKLNSDLLHLIKSVRKDMLAFINSFEKSDSPKQFTGMTYKFKILIAKNIFPKKEFARDLLNDIMSGGKQLRSLLTEEELVDRIETLKFLDTPFSTALSVHSKVFPVLRSGISMVERINMQHLQQFDLSPATLRSAQEEITENFKLTNKLRGQAIEAYHTARTHQERHDFVAAIQYYDTAITIMGNIKKEFAHPDDIESLAECHSCVAWACVKKATLEYFTGDLTRSMQSLKKAYQHMQSVPANFKNAQDEQSTKIGTLLAKLCEYDDLIRLLGDNPGLTFKYRRMKATALMEIGNVYFKLKQYHIVSNYYTRALDQLNHIPEAVLIVGDHTLSAALYTNLLLAKIRLASQHFADDHYLEAIRYAQEVLILFRILEAKSQDHLDQSFASRMVITKANIKRDLAVSLYEQALKCLEADDFVAVKQHLTSAIKILSSLPVKIINSQDAAHLKLYQGALDELNLRLQQRSEFASQPRP